MLAGAADAPARPPARVPDVVTGGRDTVGLRVAGPPVDRASCCARSGLAIAAPSANRFGRVSPTTAGHVARRPRAAASTRRATSSSTAARARSASRARSSTAPPTRRSCCARAGSRPRTSSACSTAAGAGERTVPGGRDAGRALRAGADGRAGRRSAGRRAGRGPPAERDGPARRRARPRRRPRRATPSELYARLRAADDAGVDVVVAVAPPAAGLGHAIRDRLTKARPPIPSVCCVRVSGAARVRHSDGANTRMGRGGRGG